MTRWYFEPILDSYWLAIILAGVMSVLLLVGPRFQALSQRRRLWLVALRIVLILLVLAAMLRPAFVSTRMEPQSASLLIAYDQSRSLQVADVGGNKTRWESLKETLDNSSDSIAQLTDIFDVRAYSFDAEPKQQTLERGHLTLPDSPTGDQTDIGFAIDDLLRREKGNRIIGMILLTDGAQRAHRPRADLQQAARELARLGYPLYTVTFGKPRDQSQARDVWVQNLRDQYSVFVKNELVVRGNLLVQGYSNTPIPVRMEVEDPNGEVRTIDTIQLSAELNDQQVSFEFSFTPEMPGQHQLKITAEKQPGELVTDNNQLSAFVNVLDGGMRILMLNGNLLGQEQQRIRWSIGSSPDIRLDEKRVDLRRQNEWPIDLRAELAEEYDVFLICDVPAEAIGDENATKVAQLVESGKGFMMIGGFYAFGPGGYASSPIGNLLPLEMDRFEKQEIGAEVPYRKDLHVDGPLWMLPVRDHFVTHLGPQERNQQIWRELKPLSGANKFQRLRDGATVFARGFASVNQTNGSNGVDLLVGWQVGRGRVLAFAGDTTHRWASHGHVDEHKRFWRQLMLWLSGKDATQNQDVWLQLQRRRFRSGDSIDFTTGARGVDGDAIDDAVLRVELVLPNGERQPISISPDGSHWSGSWNEPLPPGEYQIEVNASFEGKEIGSNSSRFVVFDQDLELTDPAANPEQMKMLASLTADAGGRAVAPEQLPDLLKELRNSPPKLDVQVQWKWRLGDKPLDAWAFFLIAVAVMSTEWFLRKLWGLV